MQKEKMKIKNSSSESIKKLLNNINLDNKEPELTDILKEIEDIEKTSIENNKKER